MGYQLGIEDNRVYFRDAITGGYVPLSPDILAEINTGEYAKL